MVCVFNMHIGITLHTKEMKSPLGWKVASISAVCSNTTSQELKPRSEQRSNCILLDFQGDIR